MKLLNLIFAAIIMLFTYISGNAQDVYGTLNGQMLITVVANDSVLKITNEELLIQLNYETARITIKMDKSNFITGVDTLDQKLALLKYNIIEYSGKFNLDRIDREEHPPLDFDVEGVVSTYEQIIKGKGHLEHISNRGTFSCLLTLKFNINKNDLGLDLQQFTIDDDVQIEIVQSVLNRYNDQ